MSRTIYLISHTHWDREWYLPFQEFRLKLVLLIDTLLEILDKEPDYKYFMLDGQTIVLDDYLALRPGNARKLADYIRSGRILIGPWHILPDEFLVSPEATVRNLLQGERTCLAYGAKMPVGYIPDPFGHIGQMPQILRGFELDQAVFRRGLASEPCELWWQAPDGSQVFTAYLRDSYDNAAWLPVERVESFASEIQRMADSLSAHSASSHLLLMHGTDHLMPHRKTGVLVDSAQAILGSDRLVHATLPQYLEAVQRELEASPQVLPLVAGELRNPRRHHLLPGVLSTRLWIKQRNHRAELELEKWVEPFSAWASLLAEQEKPIYADRLKKPAEIVRQIWRLLMENHPHDSICGCSVDQVHEEMRTRFDQVDQMAGEIARQSLQGIASRLDTRTGAPEGARLALLVFNPIQQQRSDLVESEVLLPAGCDEFEVVDERGRRLAHSAVSRAVKPILSLDLDLDGFQNLLMQSSEGKIGGYTLMDCAFRRQSEVLHVEAVLSEQAQPDSRRLEAIGEELQAYLAGGGIKAVHVSARTPTRALVRMLARDVPGCGYRTFWLRAWTGEKSNAVRLPEPVLENEYLRLELDEQSGCFTLFDKRSGGCYPGLNEFSDGGDAGDEYNYSPPEKDLLISSRRAVDRQWQATSSPELDSLTVQVTLLAPEKLSEDRRSRSQRLVPLHITTTASLAPGAASIRFHIRVENRSLDHRLRVHFPFPVQVETADFDGHFEVVRRSTSLPDFDQTWIEQPCLEAPQRRFASLSAGKLGLMLANRGLPEASVSRKEEDATSEIALTLLRCVGWLSRDDFPTRRGHAGPMLATPGAQMQGEYEFEYALIPHGGDWLDALDNAQAFDAPLRAAPAPLQPGEQPSTGAFFTIAPSGFVLSAVKAPEDNGKGVILRGYNITSRELRVQIKPGWHFTRVSRVNLKEQCLEDLSLNPDSSLDLLAGAHKIITLRWE